MSFFDLIVRILQEDQDDEEDYDEEEDEEHDQDQEYDTMHLAGKPAD